MFPNDLFQKKHCFGECWTHSEQSQVAEHYNDVIMSTMASQITSLAIVYSIIYSGVDQRKHQSSASLACVRGIHRCPVNSAHNGPGTRQCFPLMTSSWNSDHVRYISYCGDTKSHFPSSHNADLKTCTEVGLSLLYLEYLHHRNTSRLVIDIFVLVKLEFSNLDNNLGFYRES